MVSFICAMNVLYSLSHTAVGYLEASVFENHLMENEYYEDHTEEEIEPYVHI
jgi:hypothetical protein